MESMTCQMNTCQVGRPFKNIDIREAVRLNVFRLFVVRRCKLDM